MAKSKWEVWQNGRAILSGLTKSQAENKVENERMHGYVMHIQKAAPPAPRWVEDAPRTFDALKGYLANKTIEGIVWHHPDGRMVKIKAKDFAKKKWGAAHKEVS